MLHSKGFPHDPETALPLETWAGDEVSPEDHIAINTKSVDPGVDLSVLKGIPFPTNPPETPTPEAVEEVYGLSVIRDIPFSTWYGDPEVRGLVERLADHRGIAMIDGVRQDTGDRASIMPGQDISLPGPFVSQFLMGPVPAGPYSITRTVRPHGNYGVNAKAAANMEEGLSHPQLAPPPVRHAAFSPRTLGRLVADDYPGQHWVHAWLTLMGTHGQRAVHHRDANLDQYDWCDGGLSDMLGDLHTCISDAMRIMWGGIKWRHKHIRPAALGAHINDDPQKFRQFSELEFVKRSRQRQGNFLLPVAHPGGHPGHPSFGAGHDTCEGVGSTLTRAFFDPTGTTPWPDHVVTGHGDVKGVMTISSEALKQADNLGAGRRHIGVHWFYDSLVGRAIGEYVAMQHLISRGFATPEPVWVPLWMATVERMQLDTKMVAFPDEEE